MINENSEIARELLKEIAIAAENGSALVIGPQAVKNLHGLLTDILKIAGQLL